LSIKASKEENRREGTVGVAGNDAKFLTRIISSYFHKMNGL
jgi:hypothetical protein